MIIPLLGLAALALYALHKKKVASGQASTVTGISGTPYAVAVAPRSTSAVQIVDIFLLPNGTPIMEFAVTPPGVGGKKQFLSSPMAATDPILKRARQDFAV